MYGKCESLNQARSTFDQMHDRNVYSWNLLILSYIQSGEGKKVFELLHAMYHSDAEFNEVTLITALSACLDESFLANGQYIHAWAIEYGIETDLVVGTALVTMYGRCKCLQDAQRTFNRLPERDVVAWNSIIGFHTQEDPAKENVLRIYSKMQDNRILPDYVTFILLLEACTRESDLPEGRSLHVSILESGLEGTLKVGNALVSMYGKCGSFEDADKEFKKMQIHDVVSWNSIISVYTHYGCEEGAIDLYKEMVQLGTKPNDFTFSAVLSACSGSLAVIDGSHIHAVIIEESLESDVVIATALIDMYSKCNCLDDARNIFDRMYPGTLHIWTVMVGAYALHGYGQEALGLFWKMELLGMKPDEITYASAISACAVLADLNEGKRLHRQVRSFGFESGLLVGGALVHMYGKCGSLHDAQKAFDRMREHDLIAWNALITAYTKQGHGELTLQVFSKMKTAGIQPDEVTFVSVLSACSHAGLVDEGVKLFNSMQRVHFITPTVEHYGCMVDLYARAGYLKEAEDIINKMDFEFDSVVWETLLSACRIYGDTERGKHAAECAIQLKSQNDAPFILLSNIYAAEGRWEDVARIHRRMAELGMEKKMG
ncbi:hypothetical protein KP509_21G029400 [Ceratopteris richardii]|nr:hypothetical protein KP509_21G029400 [Ceratopteris richardii]KAH7314973.1 hypothetical protein KP509_21G029400 [Ceratopteris richardii]